MRGWLCAKIFVGAFGLVLGGAEGTPAQPTSEGRPHKWLAVEKSLTDFVADGFELKTVVYDTSENQREIRAGCALFLAERHDSGALRLQEARPGVDLLVLSANRAK
jgi:hypothetical protein